MERRCQICNQRITDDKLLACPKCQNLLSYDVENKPYLSKEQRMLLIDSLIKEISQKPKILWTISWRLFIALFLVFGVIATLTGWSILGLVNNLKLSLNKRIATEFEKPVIKQTVQDVAKSEAKRLLKNEINPEVENFIQVTNQNLEKFVSFIDNQNDSLIEKLNEIDRLKRVFEKERELSERRITAINNLLLELVKSQSYFEERMSQYKKDSIQLDEIYNKFRNSKGDSVIKNLNLKD